jgi:hypothetical protein
MFRRGKRKTKGTQNICSGGEKKSKGNTEHTFRREKRRPRARIQTRILDG